MAKLTEEQLSKLKQYNKNFQEAKLALGDAELTKSQIISEIKKMRENFEAFEIELTAEYGQDARINTNTGEVTQKENGKD